MSYLMFLNAGRRTGKPEGPTAALVFCSCLERSSTHRIAYLLITKAYEMARYFFDIKNGHRLIDPTGLDCVDDLAAMRSARTIARQIANDANPDLPRRISVLDEDRSEIGTVPVDHEDEINMEFNETLRK